MMARARLSALIFGIGVSAALLWGYVRHHPAAQPPADKTSRVQTPPDFSENRSEPGGLVSREIVFMGAPFRITVDAEAATAAPALDAIARRLRRMDQEFSIWRQEGELHKLNLQAGKSPVRLGSNAYALLELAQRHCQETGNAFGVTRAPLREPPAPAQGVTVQPDKPADCAALRLDPAGRTAFLPQPGTAVAPSLLAHGYAADMAAGMLAEHGIRRFALSAGSIRLLHAPAAGGAWPVDIPNPAWPGRTLAQFMLANGATATLDGTDAARHPPADARNIHSVTVIAGSAAAAQACTEAVAAMGAGAGMQWVEAHPALQALIVDGNGELQHSSGWSKVAGTPLSAADQAAPLVREGAHGVTLRGGRLTPEEPGQTAITDFSQPQNATRTTPEPTRSAGTRAIHPASGAMISVPGGAFVDADRRRASTTAFRIDRTEVSNRAYRRFLDEARGDFQRYCHPDEPAGKSHVPLYWKDDWQPPLLRQNGTAKLQPFDLETFRQPDDPVVGVDWWDAYCYANWAGKRLPSRDEWTKAAGGDKGRRWPWGERWERRLANVGGEMNGELDGYTYAAPADSFAGGASPYGALHMAGNVAEWTAEGCAMGGSFRSTPSGAATTACERKEPGYRGFDVGIRAAAGGKQ